MGLTPHAIRKPDSAQTAPGVGRRAESTPVQGEPNPIVSEDAADKSTATAFASSWNNVRAGSVYTEAQFIDWMSPLTRGDLKDADVLELGYGNGSLLVHAAACAPRRLAGVELGDTAEVALENLRGFAITPEFIKGDLCDVDLGPFDVVYCIGVLHHLKDPKRGFQSLLRHTRPGGRFHAWVYGREGNAVVIALVDPLRRIASRLPWWFTKYLIAGPLVTPYFLWARATEGAASKWPGLRGLLESFPLYEYTRWIAPREFWFFHHVAFDQLVTPRTRYFREREVRDLLGHPEVETESIYVIQRNGNSWKFGGRKREVAPQ